MKRNNNFFDRQLARFEEFRFGAMTFMLTFQSCYGSIAAMYALKIDSTLALAISAMVTMASNAMFIAQGTAKWCLGIFYLSIITNTLILITSVLFLYA